MDLSRKASRGWRGWRQGGKVGEELWPTGERNALHRHLGFISLEVGSQAQLAGVLTSDPSSLGWYTGFGAWISVCYRKLDWSHSSFVLSREAVTWLPPCQLWPVQRDRGIGEDTKVKGTQALMLEKGHHPHFYKQGTHTPLNLHFEVSGSPNFHWWTERPPVL